MIRPTTVARSRNHTYGEPPEPRHRFRILLTLWAFLAVFTFIGVWLVKLQADPDSKFSEEEDVHIGEVALRAPRGEIRDCQGGLLAKDRQTNSLWADPRYVKDPSECALHLSALFGVKEDIILSRLAKVDEKKRKRKFMWVKRDLTDEETEAFEKMDPELKEGLSLKTECVRLYPENDLAAHVVGFVNDERKGCEGVELAFNKYLASVPGKYKSRVDAKRNLLPSLTLEYVPPDGGDTLYLTIDKTIQHKLEDELDKGLLRAEAPRGMGIVMDVQTGAILALACRPAFNLNEFGDTSPDLYTNRSALEVFEPGSSFKIVAFAGALEAGLITPETLIDCEGGAFNPYGHRIRDFHKLDVEPVTHCFAESSNIATIKIAAMLGEEQMEDWIHKFGFDRRACLDLRKESEGIFRPRSQWSRLSMGALPIGQEIAVTIFQLARGFATIASGGYVVEPYLVERAVSREGEITYAHQHRPFDRVLSSRTAETMSELCHLVVEHGTGEHAAIPEYRVGGKTGTAQVARPNGGGYYPDKYTTVFAGFAPIVRPRICAVIVIHEPAIRLHYGGYVCGPVFKEVVRDALIRLNVPEDPMIGYQEESESEEEHPMVASREDDTASETAKKKDPAPAKKDAELPDDIEDLASSLEAVALEAAVEFEEPCLPDFLGLTKREVTQQIAQLEIPWDVQGAGWVVEQEPTAGTPLREVTFCRLKFSNRTQEERHEAEPNPAIECL